MKTNKILLGVALATLSIGGLTACSSKEDITVWVGQESVAFYQNEAVKFLQENPDFQYDISIIGADTGAAAGQLATDNSACGDIVTIANDNIGKLSQKSLILPITDPGLLAQIEDESMASFHDCIRNKLGSEAGAETFVFGVPYISQALFLYYNTDYVSAEQAKTFEGLMSAAKTANKKAFTITGTDSFNLSFTTLAVRDEDKFSSVKIYKDHVRSNCFFQGNDSIAVTRWAQRTFADPHGGMMPTSNKWSGDLQQGNVLSTIGGAWHFNAAVSALGEDHIGFSLIPTFKLTADDVEGLTANDLDSNVPTAGQVYRGGTFVDCKCMVINMASKVEKTESIVKLVKYFSSKDVQKRSFTEVGNVPAFKDAYEYVEGIDTSANKEIALKVEMAKAQLKMSDYGSAQPFDDGIKNTYFYSKGCDGLLKGAIINEPTKDFPEGPYTTLRQLRELHYNIQRTWQKGSATTDIPAELPAII